jgi:hypothetical protein
MVNLVQDTEAPHEVGLSFCLAVDNRFWRRVFSFLLPIGKPVWQRLEEMGGVYMKGLNLPAVLIWTGGEDSYREMAQLSQGWEWNILPCTLENQECVSFCFDQVDVPQHLMGTPGTRSSGVDCPGLIQSGVGRSNRTHASSSWRARI